MTLLTLGLGTSPSSSGSQHHATGGTNTTRLGTPTLNLSYTGGPASVPYNWWAGRFAVPLGQLPAGATIVSAVLKLKNRVGGQRGMTATVQAMAGFTPSQITSFLTTSTALTQVSGRPRLAPSVAWTATLVATAVAVSPTLKALVQAAINQSGWPGSQTPIIGIVLHFTSTSNVVSFANLGSFTTGPELVITWTTGTTKATTKSLPKPSVHTQAAQRASSR